MSDEPPIQIEDYAPSNEGTGQALNGPCTKVHIKHSPGERYIHVSAGLLHQAADEGLAAMADAGVPFYQRDKKLVRSASSKRRTPTAKTFLSRASCRSAH
jgi:hypothetical protein